MNNDIINMIENVEKETLDSITDPSNKNLYLLHSCLRRIYFSGLSNMITFKNFAVINELLDIQTTVKMTSREKAFIIQKILHAADGCDPELCKKVIAKINALPEADKEMYSFSEYANEKQAAYHMEQQAEQMKQSLSIRIQAIYEKYKSKVSA